MNNLDNNKKTSRINKITTALLGSALAISAAAWGIVSHSSGEEYILQGASRPALISAVQAANGIIIHEFKIIQAVSAKLTDAQVQGIASRNAMIRFLNEKQEIALNANQTGGLDNSAGHANYAAGNSKVPALVGAESLHQSGVTGKGVTVAVIDSGLGQFSPIETNASGYQRNITVVNTTNATFAGNQDLVGHGSHVTSILADSTSMLDQYGAPTGAYNGLAPDADLVMIKAFDDNGEATYSSILQGIEYAIENKDALNIRVLNLAFSFPATSFYWEDPINQALMRAWDKGITVIAPAGNSGGQNMSIGVPGNNPYVITVGALDDNATPFDTSDDLIAAFSGMGPTVEGFMKPELIAPGTNIKGLTAENSLLASENAKSGISGTSQATATTAGIVALMLQEDPSLTPNEIKCRLMASASQARFSSGELAFSPFAQGAGLVNARAAVNSTTVGCANTGLNISNDINQSAHYFGQAKFNKDTGEFTLGEGSKETKGVIWYDSADQSKDKETKGVIWYDSANKSEDKESKGVIWYDSANKSKDKETKGVIWYDSADKSKDKETKGVIWYDSADKSKDKETKGVIWYDSADKSKDKETKGVIWYDSANKSEGKETKGVIWYDSADKSKNKETKGVIWYDSANKSKDKETKGVIWYDSANKSEDKETKGVIWYDSADKSKDKETKGVIWYDSANKSKDKETKGVIWYDSADKSKDKETKGVIWYDSADKSKDKETKGVIWYDSANKSKDKETKGVIWYDSADKSKNKETKGVIWYDSANKSKDKETKGVIWYDSANKSEDKETKGVIWYDAKAVTNAESAISESGVNQGSPQMTMMKKWAGTKISINIHNSIKVGNLITEIK